MTLAATQDQPRALQLVLLLLFAGLDFILVSLVTKGADWGPLWAAGQVAWKAPSAVYDFAGITAAQIPIFGPILVRPFVYPPTALLVIAPLAVLPFFASYLLSVALAAAAFATAGRRMGTRQGLLLAPPVFLALLAGQTSVAIAAVGLLGLTRLRSDQVSAGILLGLAAAMKPTLFILAPFALLAGGHLRAIGVAAITGLCAIGLSVACFGFQPWLAWLNALPRFQALFLAEESLVRTAVTPYASAVRNGVDPTGLLVVCAAVGLLNAIFTFRRTEDVAARSVALLGGALLVSPYAMNYELLLLAPAVLTLPIRRAWDLILPFVFAYCLFETASLVGLVAVMVWFAVRTFYAGPPPRIRWWSFGSILPPESTTAVRPVS